MLKLETIQLMGTVPTVRFGRGAYSPLIYLRHLIVDQTNVSRRNGLKSGAVARLR